VPKPTLPRSLFVSGLGWPWNEDGMVVFGTELLLSAGSQATNATLLYIKLGSPTWSLYIFHLHLTMQIVIELNLAFNWVRITYQVHVYIPPPSHDANVIKLNLNLYYVEITLSAPVLCDLCDWQHTTDKYVPYNPYITPHKYLCWPCGVTAGS
jgi:hypothetical protein